VVGRLEDRGPDRVAGLDDEGLGLRLDVSGQEEGDLPQADPENGACVVLRVTRGGGGRPLDRAHQLHHDGGRTRRERIHTESPDGDAPRGPLGGQALDLRVPPMGREPEFPHVEFGQDRVQARAVVPVAVGQHHALQPAGPGAPQRGEEEVAPEVPSPIDEPASAARQFEQHGVPLPHVELRQAEVPRRSGGAPSVDEGDEEGSQRGGEGPRPVGTVGHRHSRTIRRVLAHRDLQAV
jgi:hypothetical protein